MAIVKCTRCGESRDGLAFPPFRAGTRLADLGVQVQENICKPCWDEWIGMSVKLVNETRMDTTDPRGQALWVEQMKSFLGLTGGAADPWARFLNKVVRVETSEGAQALATLIHATMDTLTFAEFSGGNIPSAFTPSSTGARGSASIARNQVRTLEAV